MGRATGPLDFHSTSDGSRCRFLLLQQQVELLARQGFTLDESLRRPSQIAPPSPENGGRASVAVRSLGEPHLDDAALIHGSEKIAVRDPARGLDSFEVEDVSHVARACERHLVR